MTSVLVLPKTFRQNSKLIEELSQTGIEVIIPPIEQIISADFIIETVNANKVKILLVGLEPITMNILRNCPSIIKIVKFGVGLDNIDIDAMKEFRIELGWTAGVNKRSVSELVLAYALGHLRNVTDSICLMREGIWEKNGGRQLSSSTVGIVGLGNIGLDVAQLLGPFGSSILYCDLLDRSSVSPAYAKQVDFLTLIRKSDIVTFHVPSTELTRAMLNSRNLGEMKSSAFVINTSRGDVVEFNAVCDAVMNGRIGGFATDVFPEEPFVQSNLNHKYLYFTPHIGGNAKEAVIAMGRSAIDHIARFKRFN